MHAISAVAESCRAVHVLQIGAAAFMAGATRMTLTTTVMVMETTGAMQLIVPLMITVFVAKVRRRPPCLGILSRRIFVDGGLKTLHKEWCRILPGDY